MNVYIAEQLTECLESNLTDYTLDNAPSKIVDHYNRMKEIGPAKCAA